MSYYVSKAKYWEKLVDYYYDNIHWGTDFPTSIWQWLEKDFKATANQSQPYIKFNDERHYSWFLLRWE